MKTASPFYRDLRFFMLRRLYTGQAGLWPGTGGGGGGGRQAEGASGERPQTATALP